MFLADADQIESVIWQVVSVGITLAIAYWFLNLFLPIHDWVKEIWRALTGQKVLVKCRKCGEKNPEDSKHCRECGEKL